MKQIMISLVLTLLAVTTTSVRAQTDAVYFIVAQATSGAIVVVAGPFADLRTCQRSIPTYQANDPTHTFYCQLRRQ